MCSACYYGLIRKMILILVCISIIIYVFIPKEYKNIGLIILVTINVYMISSIKPYKVIKITEKSNDDINYYKYSKYSSVVW
jgi:hypothetical protein